MAHRVDAPIDGGRSTQKADDVAEIAPRASPHPIHFRSLRCCGPCQAVP